MFVLSTDIEAINFVQIVTQNLLRPYLDIAMKFKPLENDILKL